MSELLDTGVWLRAVSEPETIPAPILRHLRREDASFYLSAISLWEVAKKVQIGKLELGADLADWFKLALTENIVVLPITPQIVTAAMKLKDFPNRDPADELIVATSRVHELKLITTDSKLKTYRQANIQYFTPAVQRLGVKGNPATA
jgi:PIN domain nuclease of toxin-antitoxin system